MESIDGEAVSELPDTGFEKTESRGKVMYDYLVVGSGLYGAVFCQGNDRRREEGLSD